MNPAFMKGVTTNRNIFWEHFVWLRENNNVVLKTHSYWNICCWLLCCPAQLSSGNGPHCTRFTHKQIYITSHYTASSTLRRLACCMRGNRSHGWMMWGSCSLKMSHSQSIQTKTLGWLGLGCGPYLPQVFLLNLEQDLTSSSLSVLL